MHSKALKRVVETLENKSQEIREVSGRINYTFRRTLWNIEGNSIEENASLGKCIIAETTETYEIPGVGKRKISAFGGTQRIAEENLLKRIKYLTKTD